MDYASPVIGAGAAGEAAASAGRELQARVALVERDLVGGECAYWACMPSKTLLTAAARRAQGADYPWERASRRRDWMISREGRDHPSDADAAAGMEEAGVAIVRGTARLVSRGRVEVTAADGGRRLLTVAHVVVATGSVPSSRRFRGSTR